MSESLALARGFNHAHASMCAHVSMLLAHGWHVHSEEHVAHKLAYACSSEGCIHQGPCRDTSPHCKQTYVRILVAFHS